LNQFKINIESAYEPSQHLCIDETLYSFRGRCPIRQYMPSKPSKYGLKYNNIVDVENSYMLNSDLYSGKSSKTEKNSKNVGEQTVLKLASHYYFSNRHLAFDNFFTSVKLAQSLIQNGLTCTGTLRSNKVFEIFY
jgi:hypothetical protein